MSFLPKIQHKTTKLYVRTCAHRNFCEDSTLKWLLSHWLKKTLLGFSVGGESRLEGFFRTVVAKEFFVEVVEVLGGNRGLPFLSANVNPSVAPRLQGSACAQVIAGGGESEGVYLVPRLARVGIV